MSRRDDEFWTPETVILVAAAGVALWWWLTSDGKPGGVHLPRAPDMNKRPNDPFGDPFSFIGEKEPPKGNKGGGW